MRPSIYRRGLRGKLVWRKVIEVQWFVIIVNDKVVLKNAAGGSKKLFWLDVSAWKSIKDFFRRVRVCPMSGIECRDFMVSYVGGKRSSFVQLCSSLDLVQWMLDSRDWIERP